MQISKEVLKGVPRRPYMTRVNGNSWSEFLWVRKILSEDARVTLRCWDRGNSLPVLHTLSTKWPFRITFLDSMKKYECSYAILQSNKLSIPVFSFYTDDMPISMLVSACTRLLDNIRTWFRRSAGVDDAARGILVSLNQHKYSIRTNRE